MNWIKVLFAGALVGVVLVAFRDFENERWLVPVGADGDEDERAGGDFAEDPEPVLGYDGMDDDTLLEWLDDADLNEDDLLRIRNYEASHRSRDIVLAAIDDLL